MSDLPKSTRRWLHAGWLLPLVLLVLPNCFLNSEGMWDPEFDPGDAPLTGAIMCDIPKFVELGPNGDCADETDLASGMSAAHAAVALAEGEQSSLVLDFRPDATAACNGFPKKKQMRGPFPDGLAICLNCDQIFKKYPDATAACVAKCVDLLVADGMNSPGGAQSFCESNASVSTNLSQNQCLDGACTEGGTLRPDFVDPRREQEPVDWVDLGGNATASGNNLSKLTGVPGAFDSGARSSLAQIINHGDAWVEFAAAEPGVSHVVGISHHHGGPDDPSLADIEFAISLNYDGSVYILEKGAVVDGPLPAYAEGERFRIRITDNNNGTASISYWRLVGSCTPGTACAEDPITPTPANASYPLRIEASFREPGATVSNVTMVRIKD